jgi:hypothetical protein
MEIRGRGGLLVAFAIFLAFSGAAYAAGALPKNSVGTKQLRNGAVNAKKVKKGSLTGAQINVSTLGTVPSAANAGTLEGKHASDFLGAGAAAGAALTGTYPNPTLNISGGPCPNGAALTNVSPLGALTCRPGAYVDASNNVAVVPTPWPGLQPALGGANTAVGDGALIANTTGCCNAAVGAFTLLDNTTGSGNSAFGQGTLKRNVSASGNSAFGSEALGINTIGNSNSAFGSSALETNSAGNANAALGASALEENSTGSGNAAVGQHALWQNTTGSDNVAIGGGAGAFLTTGNHNVAIANSGVAGESNTIRIGSPGTQTRAFLAGVSGVVTGGPAAPVLVDANGQLGTTSSSRRFKREINPLGSRVEGLMALRPVSFRYRRSGLHGANPLQFGLIAEQVARVYPNLVVYGLDGKPSAVAYHELPALLLAQAQRQQAQIERQRSQIRTLRAETRSMDRLQSNVRWLMRQAR